MTDVDDFALALQLQAEFDDESSASAVEERFPCATPGSPMTLVDERWEVLDPNPDVRSLFLEFNDKFFWGKLAGVEVRWSPRMTSCAGLCAYEGHGGLCSVRLSLPLLKLRPRKDLVETLLHEMIHAYLFVTHNNRDHDAHGPEFHKHMHRLNKETGTSISVYHTFHDEVDHHRQHWWQCDGQCRKKPPYFGMVRRSMNRAPQPADTWWARHQSTCGGTYTKVKEPEGFGQKKAKKDATAKPAEKPKNAGDIRKIWGQGTSGTKSGGATANPPGASTSSTNPRIPGVAPPIKPEGTAQPNATPNLPTLPGETRGPQQARGIWADEEPLKTSGIGSSGSRVSGFGGRITGGTTGGMKDTSSGSRVPGVSNIHGFGGKISSGSNAVTERTNTSGLNAKEITPSWRVAHGSVDVTSGDSNTETLESGPRFSGAGQKLGGGSNSSGDVIVRRIPGIGLIKSVRSAGPIQNNDQSTNRAGTPSWEEKTPSVNHNGVDQKPSDDKAMQNYVSNGVLKRTLNGLSSSHQTNSEVAHQSASGLNTQVHNSSGSDTCAPEPNPFGDSDSNDDIFHQASRLEASFESQKSLIDISDSDDDAVYKRCPKKIKKSDMNSSAQLNSSFKVSGFKSVSNRSFNREDMAGCRSKEVVNSRQSCDRVQDTINNPARPREVYKRHVNAVDRNKRALAADSSDSDSCDEDQRLLNAIHKRRRIDVPNPSSTQHRPVASAAPSDTSDDTLIKKKLTNFVASNEQSVTKHSPVPCDGPSLSSSGPPGGLSTAGTTTDNADPLQNCPVCQIEMPSSCMNVHLDECLLIC